MAGFSFCWILLAASQRFAMVRKVSFQIFQKSCLISRRTQNPVKHIRCTNKADLRHCGHRCVFWGMFYGKRLFCLQGEVFSKTSDNYAPCFNTINFLVIPSYVELSCFNANAKEIGNKYINKRIFLRKKLTGNVL